MGDPRRTDVARGRQRTERTGQVTHCCVCVNGVLSPGDCIGDACTTTDPAPCLGPSWAHQNSPGSVDHGVEVLIPLPAERVDHMGVVQKVRLLGVSESPADLGDGERAHVVERGRARVPERVQVKLRVASGCLLALLGRWSEGPGPYRASCCSPPRQQIRTGVWLVCAPVLRSIPNGPNSVVACSSTAAAHNASDLTLPASSAQ